MDELVRDRALAFPPDHATDTAGKVLSGEVQVAGQRRQQPRPVESERRTLDMLDALPGARG